MIYLDNASTTKPSPDVIEAVDYVLRSRWGNPSSIHSLGQEAKKIVDYNRKIVASFINAEEDEIYFTSGACEANSMALLGYILTHKNTQLLNSCIEHKSIMDLSVDYDGVNIPVDSKGMIDISSLESKCRYYFTLNKYLLVSIQSANSEIGTIQDIKNISSMVHSYHGIMHTDATQLVSNQKIDVKEMKVDMLSFSGQKIGAPKGIGVLYVKKGVNIGPIIYGSQENGLRGGTENVAYIHALGTAISILEYPSEANFRYFFVKLKNKIPDIYLVGSNDLRTRLCNNLSICFKGVNSEALLLALDNFNVFASAGSACCSSIPKPSYVLTSIGMNEEDLNSVVRFSLSSSLNRQVIDNAVEIIASCVKKLRELI